MIGAVSIRISENVKAHIYLEGKYDFVDWDNVKVFDGLEHIIGHRLKEECENENSYVAIEKGVDGKFILRLTETKRYILKINKENKEPFLLEDVHFQNKNNIFTSFDEDRIFFQFVNYLGRSKIEFGDYENDPLLFEVVPDKIDYEKDYINLTEALAEHCAGLLLDYSGSTSNIFSQYENDHETLLEQFIFLRQFCHGQNLQGLFESIKRNPDRILESEDELKPFGAGIPSKKFYTNPFSNSRRWMKAAGTGIRGYMPRDVAVTRKYDSLDTPANRFIKYALQRFDDVCVNLIEALKGKTNGRQIECLREAENLHEKIENIIYDRFFNDVGTLNIMPQNNQVLQKREGYSQIFSAYSMLELALQLDWRGKDDVYEGESKNVSLLYEYWLFFELFDILKSIDSCELVKETGENDFLKRDDILTISLQQGKKSRQCFCVKKYGLKINLYYNRTFSATEFKQTVYEGSYSRQFRPDYTLAIFPDCYEKENEAVRDGAISYLHFDAKYRIMDFSKIFGMDDDQKDKSENKKELEKELDEEKKGEVTNTYKRGDLLKMHTYNDAIRRTAGSYILYPGDENADKEFRLYGEILPGVGAFAIKPSIKDSAEKELRTFIEKIIRAESDNYTRLKRMRYYSEMVLREPSVIDDQDQKTEGSNNRYEQSQKEYILGYIRKKYHDFLKRKGLLKKGEEFVFYFYAVKGDYVYPHHKDVFNIKDFRFFVNDIDEDGAYKPEPVVCEVLSNELMSGKKLTELLKEMGLSTRERGAEFYYVLKVKVRSENEPVQEISMKKMNNMNGNDTFSPHSPKVVGVFDTLDGERRSKKSIS